MKSLGLMPLALIRRYESVCALNAVDKAGTAKNHPLVNHGLEWFLEADVSAVVKEFGPKTRVQQVACCMLGTTDVEVNLSPIIAFAAIAKGFLIVGIHVPKEVPAAASPSRHCVRLHRVAADHRPVFPLGPGQRGFTILCGQVGVHFWQGDSSVGDSLCNAVLVANGEWLSPIALSAKYCMIAADSSAGLSA